MVINQAASSVQSSVRVADGVDHVISFVAIYNKKDALCFQAGIGIRLDAILRQEVALGHTVADESFTAYALINHIVPAERRRTGWCFYPGDEAEIARTAQQHVDDVLTTPEVQALLSSVVDVPSYVAAVEQSRWPFLTVLEPYTAALIVLGRVTDAFEHAAKAERQMIAVVAERGLQLRDEDLIFLRNVQKLVQ